MSYLGKYLSVSLLVLALAGFVFGKDKSKSATVTFADDVTIAGTKVKAGEYKIAFDEQTGEFKVMKGGKTVVKTTAKLQDRPDKVRSTEMLINGNELVSVAFGGERQNVVVSQGGSAAGNDSN